MEYRVLTRSEINRFNELDRTEVVERVHYMRDGRMTLVDERHDMSDWSDKAKAGYIKMIEDAEERGATVNGAFCDNRLVGMAVVDHNMVATGEPRLNLIGLWVSHGYRGRGIARHLVRLAGAEAVERKAEALYISATPSEHTIGFYLSLGCRHADPIDPALFEKEPEDIHLELPLTGNGVDY